MSCSCISTTRTPGTPTSGSGYASRLAKNAVLCDQARLLYNLRNISGGNGCACTKPTSSKSAVYSSILEQEAANRCNGLVSNGQTSGSSGTSATNTQNILNFPKTAVQQSVRIQQIIDLTNQNGRNPSDPNTRFSSYNRIIIPLPCPVPAEQLNSTLPKPSMSGPCRYLSGA
jgi:hypothetical protein